LPKLSSAFFVRKEPKVGDEYHTFRFRVLSDFFLDIRYRKCKHVIGVMDAPIFFHLSYGTYGTLSNSDSIKLGGIKLRRDKAVFRNSQLHHRIQRKI
jgi:hypothetical protein